MRRRNREISIFNLSMMDVITGAMGAFLIVMIVLARYYEADPVNRERVLEIQAELERARGCLAEIEAAFRRAGVESSEIAQMIQRTAGEMARAQSELDRLREEIDQLNAENERLNDEVDDLIIRRPYAVSATWDCPGSDVDIYVWDSQNAEGGGGPDPLDPARKQGYYWNDGAYFEWEAGAEALLVTSAIEGSEHKIYLKLIDAAKANADCRVVTLVYLGGAATRYIRTLNAETSWVYLAHIRQVDEGRGRDYVLRTPDEAEQAAERDAIETRRGG